MIKLYVLDLTSDFLKQGNFELFSNREKCPPRSTRFVDIQAVRINQVWKLLERKSPGVENKFSSVGRGAENCSTLRSQAFTSQVVVRTLLQEIWELCFRGKFYLWNHNLFLTECQFSAPFTLLCQLTGITSQRVKHKFQEASKVATTTWTCAPELSSKMVAALVGPVEASGLI